MNFFFRNASIPPPPNVVTPPEPIINVQKKENDKWHPLIKTALPLATGIISTFGLGFLAYKYFGATEIPAPVNHLTQNSIDKSLDAVAEVSKKIQPAETSYKIPAMVIIAVCFLGYFFFKRTAQTKPLSAESKAPIIPKIENKSQQKTFTLEEIQNLFLLIRNQFELPFTEATFEKINSVITYVSAFSEPLSAEQEKLIEDLVFYVKKLHSKKNENEKRMSEIALNTCRCLLRLNKKEFFLDIFDLCIKNEELKTYQEMIRTAMDIDEIMILCLKKTDDAPEYKKIAEDFWNECQHSKQKKIEYLKSCTKINNVFCHDKLLSQKDIFLKSRLNQDEQDLVTACFKNLTYPGNQAMVLSACKDLWHKEDEQTKNFLLPLAIEIITKIKPVPKNKLDLANITLNYYLFSNKYMETFSWVQEHFELDIYEKFYYILKSQNDSSWRGMETKLSPPVIYQKFLDKKLDEFNDEEKRDFTQDTFNKIQKILTRLDNDKISESLVNFVCKLISHKFSNKNFDLIAKTAKATYDILLKNKNRNVLQIAMECIDCEKDEKSLYITCQEIIQRTIENENLVSSFMVNCMYYGFMENKKNIVARIWDHYKSDEKMTTQLLIACSRKPFQKCQDKLSSLKEAFLTPQLNQFKKNLMEACVNNLIIIDEKKRKNILKGNEAIVWSALKDLHNKEAETKEFLLSLSQKVIDTYLNNQLTPVSPENNIDFINFQFNLYLRTNNNDKMKELSSEVSCLKFPSYNENLYLDSVDIRYNLYFQTDNREKMKELLVEVSDSKYPQCYEKFYTKLKQHQDENWNTLVLSLPLPLLWLYIDPSPDTSDILLIRNNDTFNNSLG